MTKQTFDPYGSTSWPDMLDQAKLSLVWNPLWDRIKGTPLENDIPVWMAEFAQKYLERHRVREYVDLESLRKTLEFAQLRLHAAALDMKLLGRPDLETGFGRDAREVFKVRIANFPQDGDPDA